MVSELKSRIEKYFNEGNEDALPGVIEALLQRRLADKHAETDDELIEKIETLPFKDDVKDEDFESDFEDAHSTDEELEDLYNSPEYVAEKMRKNEFFNMDDKKWDHMIREGIQHGCLTDTKECEEILEDMLKWDQLLPGNACFQIHLPVHRLTSLGIDMFEYLLGAFEWLINRIMCAL